MMKCALLQLTSSDDPATNAEIASRMIGDAAGKGAKFVLTPEVTNCVSMDRTHQQNVLQTEDEDQTLRALRDSARDCGIWLLIGSLALKTHNADGRFANRSFLIDPSGAVHAKYDKIHMFDVEIDDSETYRESAGYRPGSSAVVARTDFGRLGLSICYDLRFPLLYEALVRSGAQILTVPSAFSPVTGAAHWHSLLRARAIETGCYVLAPAQTGNHKANSGKLRKTFGHSLVVSPWGDVVLDAGTDPGVYLFDLSIENVDDARRRVPSLANARPFHKPT